MQKVSKNWSLVDNVLKLLSDAQKCILTAQKHGKRLDGNNHYAHKFVVLKASSIVLLKSLKQKTDNESIESQQAVQEISTYFEDFFNPDTKDRSDLQKKITLTCKSILEPIMISNNGYSPKGDLFPLEILRNTRGYIEEIGKQANGCFEKGWFDASAVMVRRLLETLIIECYEKYNIADSIKGTDGNFFFLKELISRFLIEPKWNLSRYTKSALPKLKEIGDLSAHSRRYLAKKQDLTTLQKDIRIIIQELVCIADFK